MAFAQSYWEDLKQIFIRASFLVLILFLVRRAKHTVMDSYCLTTCK